MADKFFKFCECVVLAAFAIVCMSAAIGVFNLIVLEQVFK